MRNGRRWMTAASVALALIAGFQTMKALALPRYSARYEQNCALCHVNPTGGGLRTPYAAKAIAPEELAWSPGTPEALAAIDPMIGKRIGIGTDFREVYLAEDPGTPQPVPQGFFQMQGDVYLSFQLDSAYTLVYSRGMSNTYEVYALGYLKPWAYAKAGRFAPSYGWRFDDHTMVVRSELGFFPPAHTDVGVEVGLLRGPLDLEAALVNGNRGSVQDNDRRPAAAVSGLYRFRLGPLAASAGAEGYHQPGRTGRLDLGGVRGSLAWRDVTWLGEADWTRRDPAGGPTATGFVTSHEVAVPLHQGLDLIGTYDFRDPDTKLQSGAESRYGFGVHFYPRAFLALEALVRSVRVDPGAAIQGNDRDEGVLQLHVLY